MEADFEKAGALSKSKRGPHGTSKVRHSIPRPELTYPLVAVHALPGFGEREADFILQPMTRSQLKRPCNG